MPDAFFVPGKNLADYLYKIYKKVCTKSHIYGIISRKCGSLIIGIKHKYESEGD